jgi:hypothetical protein
MAEERVAGGGWRRPARGTAPVPQLSQVGGSRGGRLHLGGHECVWTGEQRRLPGFDMCSGLERSRCRVRRFGRHGEFHRHPSGARLDFPASLRLSERFGYLWANGDGQWFYSTTYGWLGVSPDGGSWCVDEGRFF